MSTPSNVTVDLLYDGSNNPYTQISWDFNQDYASPYTVYRNGTVLATGIVPPLPSTLLVYFSRLGYKDATIVGGQSYVYYVTQTTSGTESAPSSLVAIQIPYNNTTNPIIPPQTVPPTPPVNGAVVKWSFTDVFQKGVPPYQYVFEINPNDGGSPVMQKNFNFSHSVGPRRGSIIQEGASEAPRVAFSGIILSREQYYAIEFWYQKRIMLDLTDDLGRTFRGALDSWTPKRSRRSQNFWYHTYDAEFVVYAWSDDTGQPIYGRFT
jgi:hypothetical protein